MKIFSVTDTLSPWTNEDFQKQGVSQKKLFVASGKGTRVHDWCLNGYALSLPRPALPDLYKGYGESFKLWFDKYVVRVIWVEKELSDPELGFKGHPDLLCIVDFQNKEGEILALPDLKTPVDYSAYWQVQLSSYLHLVKKWLSEEANEIDAIRELAIRKRILSEEVTIGWIGSLQLDPKGGFPRPHRHTFAERDMAIFLSALQVRRYLG